MKQDKTDQEFGNWVIANTDNEDVFIINDSHIHPVTNLAGKTAIVNMAGWVQSHGYPKMWERYADMRTMLSLPSKSKTLFQKYGISYIVKDWRLAKDNRVDVPFFVNSPLVSIAFHNSKYTVYDVRKLSQTIKG